MPKIKKVIEVEQLIPDSVVNRGEPRSGQSKLNYVPWILIAVVILVAGYFVFNQQQQTKGLQQELSELKQNPQKIAEDETKVLLEKVGQLIELPNEQPTIATVTDLASLKDQPFFSNAQINDRVLIYSVAKKAVLYRPSTNKVIEIAPVNLDEPSTKVNTKPKASTNTNTSANANANSNTTNSSSNTSSNSSSEE